jgi:hypothetical protein
VREEQLLIEAEQFFAGQYHVAQQAPARQRMYSASVIVSGPAALR